MSCLHGLQLWVISDLSQIWVYGFRGLRRCQWRGGPEGNLWMSGDRKYPKIFKLSEFFKCQVTKLSKVNIVIHMYSDSDGSKIWCYQISQTWYLKDEKPRAVCWLKVKKDWKEGTLRWVEYLTKTVWIASSRRLLLPHRGWFQRCLVKVVIISKTLFGQDEGEVAREMMMNCYEDHFHPSISLCYFLCPLDVEIWR